MVKVRLHYEDGNSEDICLDTVRIYDELKMPVLGEPYPPLTDKVGVDLDYILKRWSHCRPIHISNGPSLNSGIQRSIPTGELVKIDVLEDIISSEVSSIASVAS